MRYRFGSYELSVEKRELMSGGMPRPLEPQVFDLLRLLVESADRLVSHDELIEKVWGGRIVSDAAVAARVSAARAALGDDGTRQEFIRTVPKHGFRFVAPVMRLESEADRETDRRAAADRRQRVGFCRSRDGTRIAYAASGPGRPLVKAGHWPT